MNNTPLVSILIPLYNAEKYIEETITKTLNQTYSNIELIIVDDHSTDQSLSIAEKYACSNIHIYSNPKKGGNAARNYAFQMSKGEYVKFMDADDYCSDNMIQVQLDTILKEGTCNSIVFSPVKMLYPDGNILSPHREIDNHIYQPGIELVLDIWRRKGWNCPHCHLMHRSLVEKSGGWDEKVIKNQDEEFFARLESLADKAIPVPQEYAVWRQTGSGVSAQISKAAAISVIQTIMTITELIYAYRKDDETKELCGLHFGYYIYEHYPQLTDYIYKIKRYLDKQETPLFFPQTKKMRLLQSLFGWQLALSIIHKFKL